MGGEVECVQLGAQEQDVANTVSIDDDAASDVKALQIRAVLHNVVYIALGQIRVLTYIQAGELLAKSRNMCDKIPRLNTWHIHQWQSMERGRGFI